MAQAANHGAYGNPVWGAGPDQGPPAWDGEAFFHRLIGSRAFWIGLVILGFIGWWPIGLALLLFSLGSGRMGCGMHRRHGGGWPGFAGPRMGWHGCQRDEPVSVTSGNRAFDDYRAETLRRLEQEQTEFAGFLDRLRFAKDKAEFDEFMAARRHQPPAPPEEQPPA
ncbi:MAG: DUF2852 domain-containing protein [Acetobacteraceae bacterium]